MIFFRVLPVAGSCGHGTLFPIHRLTHTTVIVLNLTTERVLREKKDASCLFRRLFYLDSVIQRSSYSVLCTFFSTFFSSFSYFWWIIFSSNTPFSNSEIHYSVFSMHIQLFFSYFWVIQDFHQKLFLLHSFGFNNPEIQLFRSSSPSLFFVVQDFH